jgi:two-component system chemotaxis sensor kinase CheA
MTQIDMEQFRLGFLEEATDLLEEANENILRAESEGDLELFNAVFRGIHTIKGSAGGFGFDGMSDFAHHLETLLDKLRNGELIIDGDITDLLLKGIDTLFEMVDYAKDKKTYDKDLTELIALYENRAVEDADTASSEDEEAEEVPAADSRLRVSPELTEKLKSSHPGFGRPYKVDVKFTDEMLENGYDPLTLFANLREISDVFIAETDISAIPTSDAIEPYKLYLRPEIYIISDATTEEINDLAFDDDIMVVTEINLESAPELTSTSPVKADEKPAAGAPAQTQEEIDITGLDTEMLSELATGIEDYFESVENYLIEIEKTGSGSRDAVDNIFRVFHNIKGDCGYVGFSFMEKYAHLVENMLDKVRDGAVQFDNKAAEFILNVISDVKSLVASILNGEKPHLPRTYKMLTDLSGTMVEQADAVHVVSEDVKIFLGQVDQFIEMIEMAEDSPTGRQILKRAAAGLRNAAKFIGFKDLTELAMNFEEKAVKGEDHGKVLASISNYISQLKSPPKKLGELLVESGKVTPEEIAQAKSQQKKIGEILIDQGKLNKDDLDVVLKKQNIMKAAEKSRPQDDDEPRDTSVSKEKISQSMKVDQEKIDKFTNTIGELTVAKNAYEYMVQKLMREYDLPTSLIKDIKDNSNLISRISQDLQRDILALRMVSIKQVFNKFPRVVRDISRKQNKEIDLRIIGEDTEIDKKIADILSDPLVHLVRNACDHGLEPASERGAAGKYATGSLILKAYNEGSFVYIEVIDDGRGINSEKVYKKALSKGMISEDANLSEKEIIQFILAPGFSTADKVTDISGRGVGMDVVKSSIISVGGTIDVSSSQGEGTRVTMKIPVTIGMSTSLLVNMGGTDFYAFPIENVAETIIVNKAEVKDLHFGKGIYYRGNVLPLFQLSKLLGGEDKELDDEVSIVISVTDAGKTGIIVDELLNRMDIAIKPVPEYFAHLNYIGGVTILGDGQAVLVLNVNKLF